MNATREYLVYDVRSDGDEWRHSVRRVRSRGAKVDVYHHLLRGVPRAAETLERAFQGWEDENKWAGDVRRREELKADLPVAYSIDWGGRSPGSHFIHLVNFKDTPPERGQFHFACLNWQMVHDRSAPEEDTPPPLPFGLFGPGYVPRLVCPHCHAPQRRTRAGGVS